MSETLAKLANIASQTLSPCIMSVQYTWGYSVHWGISLSTPEDVQYTGGFMSTPGVFSTVEDTMSTAGGYHDECGG